MDHVWSSGRENTRTTAGRRRKTTDNADTGNASEATLRGWPRRRVTRGSETERKRRKGNPRRAVGPSEATLPDRERERERQNAAGKKAGDRERERERGTSRASGMSYLGPYGTQTPEGFLKMLLLQTGSLLLRLHFRLSAKASIEFPPRFSLFLFHSPLPPLPPRDSLPVFPGDHPNGCTYLYFLRPILPLPFPNNGTQIPFNGVSRAFVESYSPRSFGLRSRSK